MKKESEVEEDYDDYIARLRREKEILINKKIKKMLALKENLNYKRKFLISKKKALKI
jgi:hypothetical protein